MTISKPMHAAPLFQMAATFEVAGVALAADRSGALWWEAERTIIVADLHLEKGSAFAARGSLLPPYDTSVTLAALAALFVRYAPRAVVALGDSFHDVRAGERMAPAARETLAGLMRGRDWVWISGNHDPALPVGLGEGRAELAMGALVFRHEPRPGDACGEVAGHLHPAARVVSRSGSVRRKCFVSDGQRCILPAFGAYAGGLNIRDRAFAGLFGAERVTAYMLGRENIYPVSARDCAGD